MPKADAWGVAATGAGGVSVGLLARALHTRLSAMDSRHGVLLGRFYGKIYVSSI
jgi:hypothetical protein